MVFGFSDEEKYEKALNEGDLHNIIKYADLLDSVGNIFTKNQENALHVLATRPDLKGNEAYKVVNLLVSKGVNLLHVDEHGRTPLHVACDVKKSNHDMFLALFNRPEKAVKDYIFDNGVMLLLKVATKGDIDKLKWLLNSSEERVDNSWLLHVPMEQTLFDEVLKSSANINARNSREETVLHSAVKNLAEDERYNEKMYTATAFLLQQPKIDVNCRDSNGQTVLHSMATKLITAANQAPNEDIQPFMQLFNNMLKKGAALDARNEYHQNVIDEMANIAVSEKSLEILERTIKYQRGELENLSDKCELQSSHCNSSLDVLTVYHKVEEAQTLIQTKPECLDKVGFYQETPLHRAVMSCDNDIADFIVKTKPQQVNQPDELGMTPLHSAARSGSEYLTNLLLQNEAEIDRLDRFIGESPFGCAVTYGRFTVATKLMAEGANINIQDERFGDTAFMRAVRSGDLPAVKFLVKCKADPNIRNIDGDTVFDLAVKYEHYGVLDYLFKHYKSDLEANKTLYEHLQKVIRDDGNVDGLSKILNKHKLQALLDGMGATADIDDEKIKKNMELLQKEVHNSDNKIADSKKTVSDADKLIKQKVEQDVGETELDDEKAKELALDFCANVESAINNKDTALLRLDGTRKNIEKLGMYQERLSKGDRKLVELRKKMARQFLDDEGLQKEIDSINDNPLLSAFYQEVKKTLETTFYAMASIQGGAQESPTKGEQRRKVGVEIVKMATGWIPGAGSIINKIIDAANTAYNTHQAGKRIGTRQNALDIVLFESNGIAKVSQAAARAITKTLEAQILALETMQNSEECARKMAGFFVVPMLSCLSSGTIKSTSPEMVGNEMAQAAFINAKSFTDSLLEVATTKIKRAAIASKDAFYKLLSERATSILNQARSQMAALSSHPELKKILDKTDSSIEDLQNAAEQYLRNEFSDNAKVNTVFKLLDLARGCGFMEELDLIGYVDELGVHVNVSNKDQTENIFFKPSTFLSSTSEPKYGYREAIEGLETVDSLQAKRSLCKTTEFVPQQPYLIASESVIARYNTPAEVEKIERAIEKEARLQRKIDNLQSQQIKRLTEKLEATICRFAPDYKEPGTYRLRREGSWKEKLAQAGLSPNLANELNDHRTQPAIDKT